MTEQIHQQLVLFCVAVYTGAVMALIYDVVRIYRIVRNSKVVWVWFQDVAYWTFFGYVTYAMFLKYNYGGIRSYGFLGIVLGMAIYFGTISRFFVKYMSSILIKFVNTLIKALKILCKPIKLGYICMKNRISKVIIWNKKRKQIKKDKEIQRQGELAREADPEGETIIEG